MDILKIFGSLVYESEDSLRWLVLDASDDSLGKHLPSNREDCLWRHCRLCQQ